MKKNNENQMSKRAGFTIVELLTVMAVIAILIGLLVPALSLVHDTAKDLQQKAQFHGIEVGLELYKTQFGNYPESSDSQFDPPVAAANVYTGANKLAEAMVGYDLLGFNPFSEFENDGIGPDPDGSLIDQLLYNGNYMDIREERFIDLEKANAYMLGDIYKVTGSFDPDNYVLCDSYSKRREISGKKTGMPVLYYRADTKYKIQDSSLLPATAPPTIYDHMDNDSILQLGVPEDGTFIHDLEPLLDFDLAIINDQIQVTSVPYRAQSFILISAGKDGVYGNSDDITNFEKQK